MAKPVILPMFNMDMTEALLLRWMAEEGATVREGDPLCEVETDKVNMEVEAPADGLLVALQYPPGTVVPVTSVIAYIAADAADAATVSAPAATSEAAPAAPAPAAAATPSAPAASAPAAPAPAAPAPAVVAAPAGAAAEPDDPYLTGARRRATPAVRRLARENGIALADISDRQGRVSMAAVKAAIAAKASGAVPAPAPAAAAPAPAAPAPAPAAPPAAAAPRAAVPATAVSQPLEGTRKRIAERMVVAHEAPHITLVREVRVGELMRLRKTIAPAAPSVTALIAAATVRALLAHPDVNSTFEDGSVVAHPEVNLGIAVARPEGLIVPVVHGAQNLSVLGLGDEMKRLSEAARTGRLAMGEITGGTFTITSLGQAGIDIFSPLINPPQVAILGVGRVTDRVVPVPGGIGVVPTVYLSLTCDHRIIDGAPGAEFLDTLARELETPAWLGPARREGEA